MYNKIILNVALNLLSNIFGRMAKSKPFLFSRSHFTPSFLTSVVKQVHLITFQSGSSFLLQFHVSDQLFLNEFIDMFPLCQRTLTMTHLPFDEPLSFKVLSLTSTVQRMLLLTKIHVMLCQSFCKLLIYF